MGCCPQPAGFVGPLAAASSCGVFRISCTRPPLFRCAWQSGAFRLLLHLKAASSELCPPTRCAPLSFPSLTFSPTRFPLDTVTHVEKGPPSPCPKAADQLLRVLARTQGTCCLGVSSSEQSCGGAKRRSRKSGHPDFPLKPPLLSLAMGHEVRMFPGCLSSWASSQPVALELKVTSKRTEPRVQQEPLQPST